MFCVRKESQSLLRAVCVPFEKIDVWYVRCVRLCEELLNEFQLRFWPSVSISQQNQSGRRAKKKKEQLFSKKRAQKKERNRERLCSGRVLVLFLSPCCRRDNQSRETLTSFHTQKVSLFNIPKTDKTHLYGEQEESDRTRVSRAQF